MTKCEELLERLNEYVDGAVDPSICDGFENHMAGCHLCQVIVDNFRKTITRYQAGQPDELPMALRSKLQARLREK